jgi:hypothetical protein
MLQVLLVQEIYPLKKETDDYRLGTRFLWRGKNNKPNDVKLACLPGRCGMGEAN